MRTCNDTMGGVGLLHKIYDPRSVHMAAASAPCFCRQSYQSWQWINQKHCDSMEGKVGEAWKAPFNLFCLRNKTGLCHRMKGLMEFSHGDSVGFCQVTKYTLLHLVSCRSCKQILKKYVTREFICRYLGLSPVHLNARQHIPALVGLPNGNKGYKLLLREG